MPKTNIQKRVPKTKPWSRFLRALVEAGAIICLFYSNLLMGEFIRSKPGNLSLLDALKDVITAENFAIAVVSALAVHFLFETLRKKL